MRIVHVTDGYLPRPGGIERHVHDLACRQRADGHRVRIVTSVPGTAAGEPFEVVRPAPRSARVSTALQHRFVLRAGRHDALDGADVVHVHSSSFSPLAFHAAGAASGAGSPTLVTVHSLLAGAAPLFRAADALLGWRRRPIVWSAVSHAAARHLQRALGPGRPVQILPNAVDPLSWRGPRRAPERDRVVIATVGRLALRKRPRALLRMLDQARAQLPPTVRLEAVIVGDGPLAGALRDEVRRRGMAGWVTLTGAVDRAAIRRLYRDVDIYLAPATLESFGIAALEARCAGLPVLAHAGSGIADFVTDGVDGMLADDDVGMVERLVAFASDASARALLATRARCAPPPFGWDHVLPRTYALYRRAGARVPAPAGELAGAG